MTPTQSSIAVCKRTLVISSILCTSVLLLLVKYSFHISTTSFCFQWHMYYKLQKNKQNNTTQWTVIFHLFCISFSLHPLLQFQFLFTYICAIFSVMFETNGGGEEAQTPFPPYHPCLHSISQFLRNRFFFCLANKLDV